MSDTLSLLQLFQVHRRGELMHHAEKKYRELIEAIEEHGGSGHITIKIPLKRTKSGTIESQPSVSISKPEKALSNGIYWLGRDGRLSQRDPEQYDLEDDLSARRAERNGTNDED